MRGVRRYTATSRPSDTSVSAAPSEEPLPVRLCGAGVTTQRSEDSGLL